MKVRKFFYNLVFLLSMFAVVGCNFSSETQDEDNFRNFNSDEKGTILVTLKSKNNELFSQSSSQNTNDSSKRSAVPSSLSASAFAFKCELKNADETISVPLDNIKLENSILSMEFGVVSFARTDYKLSINAVDPDDTNVILLVPESGTIPVNIAARGDTFSADVELVPYSSIADVAKYYGSVKLGLQIPSGYTLDYSDSSGNKPFGNLSIEDGVYKISASVKAGQYSTYFYIKKNEEIVDVFLETIHVYPKMQTDRWNTGNADDTKNIRIIDSVQVGNTFFVSSTTVVSGGVFATLGSAGGDDNASGSIKNPYATIQKPLSKIKNIYDSGQTFTIYVEGTVTSGTGANSVDFSSFANTQNIYLIGLNEAQETGSLNFYPTGEGQTLNLGGKIFVNEIKLKKDCTITAQNNLSCVSEKSIITTIIPQEYTGGTQILVAGNGVDLSSVVDKFEIENYNGKKWYIDSEGKLQKKLYDTVYLDSTATVDGEGGIVTSPVKTFESALSVLNKSATSPEIVIMKAYTLSDGEESILDFSAGFTNKVTLKRYSGCTGDLISVMNAMQGKTVTIKNAIFDGDGANIENPGGSLLNICLNSGEATVNVSNSVFKDNKYGTTSNSCGGAIYNNRTLIIDNSEISNNTATSGGGIYNNGTLTVSDIIISGNTATSSGGGICNYSGIANLSKNLQIADSIYIDISSPSIKIKSDFSLKSVSSISLECLFFNSSYIGSSIIESSSGSMTQEICDKFTLPTTYSLAASGAYGILATSVNTGSGGIPIVIPGTQNYTITLDNVSVAPGNMITCSVSPTPDGTLSYTMQLKQNGTTFMTVSTNSITIPSWLPADNYDIYVEITTAAETLNKTFSITVTD